MIGRATFFLIPFLFLSMEGKAQFALDTSDLPKAPATYVYSLATLGPTTPPLSKDGRDVVWNYLDTDRLTQEVDTFFTVSNTPSAYRLRFDNPFDPDYLADHAYKVPERGTGGFSLPIQVEDRFDYYRKTPGVYELLGFGATINGLPVSARYDPKDELHPMPLRYDTSASSYAKLIMDQIPDVYYEQEVWRKDTVDGVGRLVTPYETYDPCLRLKTHLTIRDSLKSDSLGIDTAIVRPEKVLYEWMAEGERVPVMRIVVRGGAVNRVEYRDTLHNTSIASEAKQQEGARLYPNPTSSHVELGYEPGHWEQLELRTLKGERLLRERIPSRSSHYRIDMRPYPAGTYIIRFLGDDGTLHRKLVKR
jgi:hypothetical protein